MFIDMNIIVVILLPLIVILLVVVIVILVIINRTVSNVANEIYYIGNKIDKYKRGF